MYDNIMWSLCKMGISLRLISRLIPIFNFSFFLLSLRYSWSVLLTQPKGVLVGIKIILIIFVCILI